MTARHQHPEYLRNSRIVRTRTRSLLASGIPVVCVGCGRAITPDQTFDVGHIVDAARGGSHDLINLGPQHRRENRRAGGRIGAAMTNSKSLRANGFPTWL